MKNKDYYFTMFISLLTSIILVMFVYLFGIKLPVTTFSLMMNEGASILPRLQALGLFMLWLVGVYIYLEFMTKEVIEKREER